MTSHRQLNPFAVKDFAELKGKTNRQVALDANLSESYFSEMMKGTKPGSPKAWQSIADALGVELWSITERRESKVA